LNGAALEQARRFYLSLGSNVRPEHNLAKAIELLQAHGPVQAISGVWESRAVGSQGPNFLNVCLGFVAPVTETELKQRISESFEIGLGRTRTSDKSAPRTIDIHIIMEGNCPRNPERWTHAFVVLPLSELLPDTLYPISHKHVAEEAIQPMASTWTRRRPEGVAGLGGEHEV